MQQRVIRRSLAAAFSLLLVASIAAFADTVPADGDAVTPGNQTLVDLGQAGPGQVVTHDVTFALTCSGLTHVAPGTTISIDLSSTNIPAGSSATATSTSIGPVPDTWTPSGIGCPSPAPTLPANGPSTVSLTMPTTPGNDLFFTIIYSRTPSTGLSSATAITFQIDVLGNTPPVLQLPGDQLVEATSPAGATVTYTATATDAEDATPPTPVCTPDSGSTFPLGVTTVQCTATDSGGLSDTGSFNVAVEDTTPPSLAGMPSDQDVTTADPSGAVVSWTDPTATDLADPSPSVTCDPPSGSQFPVGSTLVTCTARDASGNQSSASFSVNVTLVNPVVWSAVWGEPVATNGAAFVANAGRTVPIKVLIFADGVEQTTGSAVLSVGPCGGPAGMTIPLTWDGGRWTGHLDTSVLGPSGCYLAVVSLDGNVAGNFTIDLRGGTASPAQTPRGSGRT